jgi:hypothetical protein
MMEQLFKWLRNTRPELERKWWYWPVAISIIFLYRLLEHRILGSINAGIDVHSAEYLQQAKPYLLWIANPLLIPLLVFVGVISFILVHAYIDTLPSRTEAKESVVPIAVGLTFESAEADILPDSAPDTYKFKLRVYLANYSGETIHLGVPEWQEDRVALQWGQLNYSYQLRLPQKPWWGDEAKEIDVPAGRRLRMWLGLDPARKEEALKMLDTAGLGLLIIPVNTPNYLVRFRIRPADRGLRHVAAKEYDTLRNCVSERFMGMDHAAKEAIRILSFGRVMSAQQITDHLRERNFPNADKVFDSLRNDIVPLVASFGNAGEFRINPALEKIVKEAVAADKKEFLEAASKLPADQFAYKAKNEPGFVARYNTIAPKD